MSFLILYFALNLTGDLQLRAENRRYFNNNKTDLTFIFTTELKLFLI